MPNKEHYILLADLFRYPEKDFAENLKKNVVMVYEKFPDFSKDIYAFVQQIEKKSLSDLEEYYVNTFLLQPVSSLDLGFLLFGNDSKRNEFLISIKGEQSKVGNYCGNELPDHLPNILTLIAKIKEEEFCEELSYCLVIPAIKKLKTGFETTDNYYKYIIELLLKFLENDFSDCKLEQFQIKVLENKVQTFQ